MKILFFNSFSLRVGSGPEHWLMDVSQRLQKLNNQVTIVSPTCGNQDERFSHVEVTKRLGKVKYEEFSCVKFPKFSSSPLPINMLDTFTKKADVIYFLNGFALQDIFVTLDKMITKTPIICGLHGPLITTYSLHNLYVSLIFKRNLRLANACHVLNPFYVELLHRWRINNVYLIPNGIDTEKFQPLNDINKGEKFRVLFIGRFAYEKGIDILCKAIDLLNRDKSLLENVEFTLIGRGPLLPIVQRTIQRHYNVVMKNFVAEEELTKEYCNHHLFALPARFETFPLPPLEAQACGLPIITTDIPGTREQVSLDGGAVIQVENYFALAKEITKYYYLWKNDRERYEFQCDVARKNVLVNFEIGKMVSRIYNLMCQVRKQRFTGA